MTGAFPSVLKTAEVKILNLIIATIVQSPCYQILKKYLKNLCIRDYVYLP